MIKKECEKDCKQDIGRNASANWNRWRNQYCVNNNVEKQETRTEPRARIELQPVIDPLTGACVIDPVSGECLMKEVVVHDTVGVTYYWCEWQGSANMMIDQAKRDVQDYLNDFEASTWSSELDDAINTGVGNFVSCTNRENTAYTGVRLQPEQFRGIGIYRIYLSGVSQVNQVRHQVIIGAFLVSGSADYRHTFRIKKLFQKMAVSFAHNIPFLFEKSRQPDRSHLISQIITALGMHP